MNRASLSSTHSQNLHNFYHVRQISPGMRFTISLYFSPYRPIILRSLGSTDFLTYYRTASGTRSSCSRVCYLSIFATLAFILISLDLDVSHYAERHVERNFRSSLRPLTDAGWNSFRLMTWRLGLLPEP